MCKFSCPFLLYRELSHRYPLSYLNLPVIVRTIVGASATRTRTFY
jgi:hypothetical protein